MKWEIPFVLVLLSACQGSKETVTVPLNASHALNWTCEKLAQDYRENPKANSALCSGYDRNGWPIDGAKISLPENW